MLCLCFFFFKQKTAYEMRISDWSSDVCSSDLLALFVFWGFSKYLFPYEKPRPQIIYFENWTANRSDAQVRADWVDRAKQTTRENAARRAEFQKLAEMMEIGRAHV